VLAHAPSSAAARAQDATVLEKSISTLPSVLVLVLVLARAGRHYNNNKHQSRALVVEAV
jgi:hypothetical protein